MKNIVTINPSTNMLDVLGHAGYTFPFAIADLIDNSIAAKAKTVLIYLDISALNPYLYILDDGVGMDRHKLQEAAVIGHTSIATTRKGEDLGRYSTGLKSATNSFADNLIISSKCIDASVNTIQIDFKYIRETKQWNAFWLSEDEFEMSKYIKDQGTMVFCNNLSIIGKEITESNIYNKLDNLIDSLSHIFGKYILEKGLKIYVQTAGSRPIEVKGWNPFTLQESKAIKLVAQKSFLYGDSHIEFNAYVLPVYNNLSLVDQDYMRGRGLLEQQGFYIYRNDRLIQEGGWLNLPEVDLDAKCNYARIEVKISSKLDEKFKVNFCKNTIVVPDDLQYLFKEIALKTRKESRNSFNYKRHPELKKSLKSEEEKIWKVSSTGKGMVLTINDTHPIIDEICSKLSKFDKKKLFTLISNAIPVNLIQNQETTSKGYSENELFVWIEDQYNKFKMKNLSLGEIKKRLARMEPFKDYKEVLIKFFDTLEDSINEN